MARLTYQIIVVSDLHLSDGWDPETKKLSRNEDFFFDLNFQRFLQHLAEQAKEGGFHYRLVINGDFADFLQFTKTPDADSVDSEIITDRERELGLGTTPAKTLWKLERLISHHKIFFDALRDFIGCGNEVILIPGNHDIEWMMHEVQEGFRKEMFSGMGNDERGEFNKRVHFLPWFFYDPGLSLFVEHGCQYDPLNSFDYFLYPFRRDGSIELPAGSFFVRYLFNRVESDHPFADNMKPMSNFICWALRRWKTWFSWPPQIVKFMLFFLDTLNKTHALDDIWRRKVETEQDDALASIAEEREMDIGKVQRIKEHWAASVIHNSSKPLLLKSFVENSGLDSAYYCERAGFIQRLLDVRYVVFGHTHNADICQLSKIDESKNAEYVNSGTWTKTFAANHEEALLTEENEFVFVHVRYDEKKEDTKMELLRWNDAIGEGQRVRLFEDNNMRPAKREKESGK
jgi:UDP-2,3-diacylglucosamine pyrophosphatase LpxH